MLVDNLSIPARNTVQVMAEKPDASLRTVETFNAKRKKTETVAQVAQWTGTRWDGYYLTEAAVVEELVNSRIVVADESGNFHLTDFVKQELQLEKERVQHATE